MDLKRLYNDPTFPASFAGKERFYKAARLVNQNVSKKSVEKDLKAVDSYTLHKPTKKASLYRRVFTKGIGYLYEADLVDMSKFKHENDGYTFLITIIDTFSKKAWAFKLKRKTGKSIVEVMSPFLRDNKPQKMSFDQGTEFYNKLFLEEKKRMDQEFQGKMRDVKKKYATDLARIERDHADEIAHIKSKHNQEIQDKQLLHDKQQADLENAKDAFCNDTIKKLEDKCENEKKKIRETYVRQLADEEEECNKKLGLLHDQIKSLQEDDENSSSLTKAIFNCTSMEEIYDIQKLIKNHQLDVVVQRHLPTLQNLFLSLSYGILPICQPQREKVSNEQRKLVEKIQTASRQMAKKLLKENRAQVVNLFTIIDDSLKLARNTYNRYGIAP